MTTNLVSKVIEDYWVRKLESVVIPRSLTATEFQQMAFGDCSVSCAPILGLTRNNPISEFTLLLSAYAVLIFKNFNSKDIVIASPDFLKIDQANSNNNLLFFRLVVDPSLTLRETIRNFKIEIENSFKHRDIGFDVLTEKLKAKNIEVNSILNFGFNYGSDGSSLDLLDSVAFKLNVNKAADDFNINLTTTAISLDVIYVSNFLNQLNKFLTNIEKNLDTSLAKITLQDNDERDKLLLSFERSNVELRDFSISQLFEMQVAQYPKREALFFEGESITYDGLNSISNKLAHHLETVYRVSLGDRVVFFAEKDHLSIIAILAILKVGGVYVPVDPFFAESRRRTIIEDVEPKVILIRSEYISGLLDITVPIFAIDIQLESLTGPRGNLDKSIKPSDLGYILYTSGSTGRPKGIMMEQRSIVNLIEGLNRIVGHFDEFPLRVALVAPFVFDASVQQIFFSLMNGYTLYIVKEEIKRDAAAFWDYLHNNAIQICDSTPALFNLMLERKNFHNFVSHLEFILIGGEQLNQKAVSEFYKYHGCGQLPRLINVYGPTECCVDCTSFEITFENYSRCNRIPIGKPLLNKKVYILDNEMEILPIGAVGQICVSGIGISNGYWKDPELTSKNFCKSPFNETDSDILYFTGDYGKWLPDGNIEFIGRLDDQVKVRGYRIELAEIKFVLDKFDRIKDCCVLLQESSVGQKIIVAYIVADDDLSLFNILDYVKKYLPNYMVPETFVAMDSLPLNVNGKIDRDKLKKANGKILLNTYIVIPRNDKEEVVYKIWEKVLDNHSFGVKDNFFDIGGNSLKLVEVLQELYKLDLARGVSVADLFRFNTVESICNNLFFVQPQNIQDFDV